MADSTVGGALPPNIILTQQQQKLLLAALNSNRPQQTNTPSIQPEAYRPTVSAPAFNNQVPFDTSYLDNLDYDFGDSSFDFSFNDDQNTMTAGDGEPGTANSDTSEGDNNEKRSHPDDEDEEAVHDPKRRESSDNKMPKKPGRKPLTSEPTTKRKAQNRAAQRAFRERKEKHLKDLETKVEELEKASSDANHENSKLRAQIETMTSELNQYKQQISLMTGSKTPVANRKVPFGMPAIGNLGDINFQFEFPKFGSLPGPPSNKPQSTAQAASPQQNSHVASPTSHASNRSPSQAPRAMTDAEFKEELAKFNQGMFTPSMASTHGSGTNGSRGSLDSANYSMGNTSSPSASSHSNMGPSSSCGTSPEPTQSPMVSKPLETLTTIGEENSFLPMGGQTGNDTIAFPNTGFDWLSQQNGGQFDPQLFGDYREPQDNILSNASFDDFFNDALDSNDFITPYNMASVSPMNSRRPNLIDDIDAQKNDDSLVPTPNKNMNCTQLWEKLQSCPKAQTGEFDLDGLCNELTKKAKCSGNGPVVGEMDFDTILKKFMGKDVSSSAMAGEMGVELRRQAGGSIN